MSEAKITTISDFFEHSGLSFRVFDMGRRVSKISETGFAAFENAQLPYPLPFQRSALFGIIFWHPKADSQHFVWFLKFPLDEQGLLLQSARDEFLVMLLERVGESMLAAADGNKLEGALKDSPYSFTPREDKMAAFNAHATFELDLKASQYYPEARAYFTGKSAKDSWDQLGMQGVADVAVRLADCEETPALAANLASMPPQPFHVLCTFLENASPSAALTAQLQHKLAEQLSQEQPDAARICACLRAASNSQDSALVDNMVKSVLEHPCSRNVEVLAVIGGRCWTTLQQSDICKLYVEQLAHNDAGYPAFSQLLADLVFVPGMREPVMQALRDPQRSDLLSEHVGTMFG
ncbi:DUF3549 family protein [uncultured Methylophaga sp.]|uniref:DUF3549 family protein n=1 Tax=uncultured Methylophaga sp. TaxID=285271 RepID=UPI002627087E|nr:DUF3549 family protein [uncultured Methylophaga sp.]